MTEHYKLHINEDINDYYDIKEVLGRGAFSEVKRGISKKDGKAYAVKIMSRTGDDRKMEIINIEIEILKLVCHDNVVKLYEVFETKTTIMLVIQLITGGELFERVVKLTCYSENDARKVIKQLLEGIGHLHSKNVIHRDLKPENLLLDSDSADAALVITDFGLSAIQRPGEVVNRAVGTPGYLAPEVLVALDTGKGYGPEVDLFGVGVIMYILLCGFPPFYGDDEEEVYVKTETGDYSYPSPFWDGISKNARDLIDKLLLLDPSKRITIADSLKHPWITEEGSTKHLDGTVAELKKFNAKRKFKGAVKGLIAMCKMQRLTVPPSARFIKRDESRASQVLSAQ